MISWADGSSWNRTDDMVQWCKSLAVLMVGLSSEWWIRQSLNRLSRWIWRENSCLVRDVSSLCHIYVETVAIVELSHIFICRNRTYGRRRKRLKVSSGRMCVSHLAQVQIDPDMEVKVQAGWEARSWWRKLLFRMATFFQHALPQKSGCCYLYLYWNRLESVGLGQKYAVHWNYMKLPYDIQ